MTLRRILGPATIVCVGLGVAIGSGVLATPGEIAGHLASPWIILAAWLLGGVVTVLQCLVTAELVTRLPRAGGEYQFLREAYGDFAAFFFGWSFTIFIVGGGAGTIASALGRFAVELFGLPRAVWPEVLGCAAIVGVTVVNAAGLRTGAAVQSAMSVLKTLALLAIGAAAMVVGGRATPTAWPTGVHAEPTTFQAFMLAFVLVYWSYSGATDAAKLAEETTDVRRTVPRALVTSALLLTLVYCAFNYALLCGASPALMRDAPDGVAAALGGGGSRRAAGLAVGILICLGSLSSTILSNVRVTFAMARDGLTFTRLARMTPGQAPVESLWLAAVIACAFVVNRSFTQIIDIYFLASAVLFGMSYASLIVFRRRDRRAGRPFPPSAFRAPGGAVLAIALIAWEGVVV